MLNAQQCPTFSVGHSRSSVASLLLCCKTYEYTEHGVSERFKVTVPQLRENNQLTSNRIALFYITVLNLLSVGRQGEIEMTTPLNYC